MKGETLLSLHQAATAKGVPVHDVERAIEAGDLPAVRQGGAWYVRPADLESWTPHPKTAAGADFTDQEAADFLRSGEGS